MSKVNALPKNYGTCAFCSMDFPDVYRCPKCKQLFCGVKCYRSTGHASCSEDFYKSQIEQHLKLQRESDADSDDEEPTSSDSNEKPTTSKPTEKPSRSENSQLTFEQYMEKHKKEDARKMEEELNPQIEIGADEELVIDPDDEAEYIQTVLTKAMKDYDHMDDADLDKQLAELDIDINDEEQLLKKLTPEELRAFKRVAEEMFEIPQQSCFK